MAIRSFADKELEAFHRSGKVPRRAGWGGIAKVAGRKLDMLRYAAKLQDLRAPPSNRLEALKGDWKGYYSIRINDQFRVVFRWSDGGASNVDIVDYH